MPQADKAQEKYVLYLICSFFGPVPYTSSTRHARLFHGDHAYVIIGTSLCNGNTSDFLVIASIVCLFFFSSLSLDFSILP